MKTPKRLDLTPGQADELMGRIKSRVLTECEWLVLEGVFQAMIWMCRALQEKKLSIRRLMAIFGTKTESLKNLIVSMAKGKAVSNQLQAAAEKEHEEAAKNTNEDSDPNQKILLNKKTKGHGHKPASAYTQAKLIAIAHLTLQKGSNCPSCFKGKLFNLDPGSVIRIIGGPWLQMQIYQPERLRCPVCGQVFTATLPKEVMIGSRADHAAKAIVSLLKYRAGLPFYRQDQMLQFLNTPISATEIWQMTADVAEILLPIYAVVCVKASEAELIQNDDTTARILSVIKDRKKQTKEDKRTGIFTTVILAHLKGLGVKIGLFFTGKEHAGENLDKLLASRSKNLPPPLQQCDGGNNVPKNHETQISNCLSHSRRKFYELVEAWPAIVIKVIGWFATVFANDKFAPSDPKERLKWHQEKSGPILDEMKEFFKNLIEGKTVEPNSSLGKAIAYFNNHWEGLTLFLRVPGAIIHNNDTEQLIKRAVLNRKNAYFYRNETGAKIGDILMSMMETCILNDKNPSLYMVAVQDHEKDVRRNPNLWVPWAFEARLKELTSLQQQEALRQSQPLPL